MPDAPSQTRTSGSTPSASNDAGPVSRQWSDLPGHLVFWLLAALGLAADLWTKSAVHDWLRTLPDQRYTVVQDYVWLVIRFNRGAAFSMFQGRTGLLLAVSGLALLVVLGLFLFTSARQRLLQVALGLLTAGILGNLYDRVFNEGAVRDWIEVVIPIIDYRWPAFNVADSLLCIAVGLIVLLSFTSSSYRTPARPRR